MHIYTYNEAEEVIVLEILSSSPYYLLVKSFMTPSCSLIIGA